MKNAKRTQSESGQGLVVLIILLIILLIGVWWLYGNKKTMDQECRAFGKRMIHELAVNHNVAFFRDNLGPQAKMDYPPARQQDVIGMFTKLGVPNQPINIEENVTFESKFFSPRGFFTAQLLYPTTTATMQVAVSHPVGKWQLDDLSFTTGPVR